MSGAANTKSFKVAPSYYAPYAMINATAVKKKERKMNWFRKKFMEWSRQAWEDHKHCKHSTITENERNEDEDHGLRYYHHKGINFTVHPAEGGHVIEYQDRKTDTNKLSVVTSVDDIGSQIQKIIVMEALTR